MRVSSARREARPVAADAEGVEAIQGILASVLRAMDNIYVSTNCIEGDLQATLQLYVDSGIHRIELGALKEYGADELQYVRNCQARFLLHSYFPPAQRICITNLASPDPLVHDISLDHCRRAIDFCEEVGAPLFSIHAGYSCDRFADPAEKAIVHYDRGLCLRRMIESLVEVCRYAREKSVSLLIEQGAAGEDSISSGLDLAYLAIEPAELDAVVTSIHDDNFGLLVDLGHLKINANRFGFDPVKFIHDFGPVIRAFHLHDNDGSRDSHSTIDTDTWFLPVLRDFGDRVMVIESAVDSITAIKESCSIVANTINSEGRLPTNQR